MRINIAEIFDRLTRKAASKRPKYHYADDGLIEYKDGKGRVLAVVPCWRAHLIDESRYTGSKLRAIRAKNGVGRPPHKSRTK